MNIPSTDAPARANAAAEGIPAPPLAPTPPAPRRLQRALAPAAASVALSLGATVLLRVLAQRTAIGRPRSAPVLGERSVVVAMPLSFVVVSAPSVLAGAGRRGSRRLRVPDRAEQGRGRRGRGLAGRRRG